MFDYDQESKHAAEVLDEYDFSPTLRNCYGVDLYDIEDLLKSYGGEVIEAISNLTTDELTEYLHQKYDVRVEEVSRYCIWWNSRWREQDG